MSEEAKEEAGAAGAAPAPRVRPFDRGTNKPVATEQEVNRTAHNRACAAAEAARHDPDPGGLEEVVMAALARPKTIAGQELQPMTIGINLILQKLGSLYMQAGDGGEMPVTAHDVMRAAFVFINPDRSFELLVEREDRATFDLESARLGMRLGQVELGQLNDYINGEFAAFGMAAKKPEPGAREMMGEPPASATASSTPSGDPLPSATSEPA